MLSQILVNLLEDRSVLPIVCCAIFGEHNWHARRFETGNNPRLVVGTAVVQGQQPRVPLQTVYPQSNRAPDTPLRTVDRPVRCTRECRRDLEQAWLLALIDQSAGVPTQRTPHGARALSNPGGTTRESCVSQLASRVRESVDAEHAERKPDNGADAETRADSATRRNKGCVPTHDAGQQPCKEYGGGDAYIWNTDVRTPRLMKPALNMTASPRRGPICAIDDMTRVAPAAFCSFISTAAAMNGSARNA